MTADFYNRLRLRVEQRNGLYRWIILDVFGNSCGRSPWKFSVKKQAIKHGREAIRVLMAIRRQQSEESEGGGEGISSG